MSFTQKARQVLFRKEKIKAEFGEICDKHPDLFIIAIDPETGHHMATYKGKVVTAIMPPRVIKTTLKYTRFQEEVFNLLEHICKLLGFNPHYITEHMQRITDSFFVNIGYLLNKLAEFRQANKQNKK